MPGSINKQMVLPKGTIKGVSVGFVPCLPPVFPCADAIDPIQWVSVAVAMVAMYAIVEVSRAAAF